MASDSEELKDHTNSFKAICDFVKDLNDVFGEENQPIKLYSHLISKTTMGHIEAVNKHITIFKNFCSENKESILNQDSSKLINGKIEYSQRVYIDLEYIFTNADNDIKSAVWNHLLFISSNLENNPEALKLMSIKKPMSFGTDSKESEFLSNMVEKIQSKINIQDTSNPMECVSSLMSSGVVDELVTEFKDNINTGKIDLGGLMNSLQGMMSNLNSEIESTGASLPFNPADMFNSLMAGMNTNNGPVGAAPIDISTIFGQLAKKK